MFFVLECPGCPNPSNFVLTSDTGRRHNILPDTSRLFKYDSTLTDYPVDEGPFHLSLNIPGSFEIKNLTRTSGRHRVSGRMVVSWVCEVKELVWFV